MSLKRLIAGYWATSREREIRKRSLEAIASQEVTLHALIRSAKDTAFGRQHGFDQIRSHADFTLQVPVTDYEQSRAWFDRIYKGEEGVTWPGKPLYLAKTSGTTSGAKYIPITKQSIRYQIKGARDALLLYVRKSGNARFLDGKMLFLSGSPVLDTNDHGIKVGRLSGIVNHWVPGYLRTNQIPSYETNCIEDWETKVDKVLTEAIPSDLRLISGIPPWVQMFFERLKERTGKRPLEQWPNLQVFVQGGVDFSPYRPIFRQFFEDKVDIVEVFPASEGFFAIQDDYREEGLLLNLDYGMYYEFIPLEEYGKENATRLRLAEVELNKSYALVVSSNAGLWGYDIGDTVKFVSLNPFKIKVAGRVKHFLSAFGEHVIEEEVNKAMIIACARHEAEVQEFTVMPLVSETRGQSYHDWWMEFTRPPQDLATFAETLDEEIRKQNVYYDDLRRGSMLLPARVQRLQVNAAREAMKAMGKLGGQNKFPRLSNNRKLEEVLKPYLIQP